MGYTHYWRRKRILDKDEFIRFKDHINLLLDIIRSEGIAIAGRGGTGNPEINNSEVAFNGRHDDDDELDESHETFRIDRVYVPESWERAGNKRWFVFCKTARKPYDLMVTCSLILAKYHFGNDIIVSSDGDEEEWKPAFELLQSYDMIPYFYNFSAVLNVSESEVSNGTTNSNT